MTDEPVGSPTAFEDYPLTRAEYISALVHFYRGELGRAHAWRARLDPTTNWAVVTVGAMLSIGFSGPEHGHETVLLSLLLVSVFLGFEARRYRIFDVWRSRVRMIEENFWVPMLRRDLVSPQSGWRDLVADDLHRPTYKLTALEAIGLRLRYNYLWIYMAVLAAWLVKLYDDPIPARTVAVVVERSAIGPFGGAAVFGFVVAFYALAVGLAVWSGRRKGAVDEVYGLERALGEWKSRSGS